MSNDDIRINQTIGEINKGRRIAFEEGERRGAIDFCKEELKWVDEQEEYHCVKPYDRKNERMHDEAVIEILELLHYKKERLLERLKVLGGKA